MDLQDSEAPIPKIVRARSGQSYRVIDRLGRGGNATVYLVIANTGPHRGILFALKLFREIDDEQRLGRFKREAAFLLKCDHPALMRVYDEGEISIEENDPPSVLPYMIVEYLPKTLDGANRVGLSMSEKISFALQLLSGLSYLSSREPQVVHRDIKPQNIFVRGRACMLGDFGLMKILGDDEPADVKYLKESTGIRLPRYFRTPDLVLYCRRKADLTVQSDVFQLGLVLAVLFTGFNPLRKTRWLLSKVKLDPIEIHLGDLSVTIKGILDRMLDYNPKTRPTAVELLELWEGAFLRAIDMSHGLEGRLFA